MHSMHERCFTNKLWNDCLHLIRCRLDSFLEQLFVLPASHRILTRFKRVHLGLICNSQFFCRWEINAKEFDDDLVGVGTSRDARESNWGCLLAVHAERSLVEFEPCHCVEETRISFWCLDSWFTVGGEKEKIPTSVVQLLWIPCSWRTEVGSCCSPPAALHLGVF